MKKLIGLVLALAVVFTFAGCSASFTTTTTTTSTAQESRAESSSKSESSSKASSKAESSKASSKSESSSKASSSKASSSKASSSKASSSKASSSKAQTNGGSVDFNSIPEYSGDAYITVNSNQPYFTKAELDEAKESFEDYSPLDYLGRCGPATASVSPETQPTEPRGSISKIKPTGWHSVNYPATKGQSLYNRSHLIAYCLSGENANERNLITGTMYMNQKTMTIFENMTNDYIDETGNHVLYRVTPDFKGDNLVASGVLMEAYSIEDDGDGICFNVYCYNVQPGIVIDYSNGDSEEE